MGSIADGIACGRTSPAADNEPEKVWALDFVQRSVVVVVFF